MDQEADEQTRQDDGSRCEADLPLHAPPGAGGPPGAVQVVAVGRPGTGAAGEGGGTDPAPGENPAGVPGAGTGGAHDQDITAVNRVADVGQGLLDPVEGDVEGAGEVTAGVLARGTDVDDGQFVQAGTGLIDVEVMIAVVADAILACRRCPGQGEYITPGGIYEE